MLHELALTRPLAVASLNDDGQSCGPRGVEDVIEIDAATVLAANVAVISAGARVVLLVLIGVLLLVLGVLVGFAMVVRRRGQGADSVMGSTAAMREACADEPFSPSYAVRAGMGSSGLMAAVAEEEERVACPTCGQIYEARLQHCPADSRPLVPLAEAAERSKEGSAVCVTCDRAFEVGVRYCPHDASKLVPTAVYEATRGKVGHLAFVGIEGRICPQCRRRSDLGARFCPHDGAELDLLH